MAKLLRSRPAPRADAPAGPRGASARPRGHPLTVSRSALLADGSDTAFRELIHDLIVYGHHLDTCRDWFGARIGLSGTQYEVLMIVYRAQAAIGVSELAARMCRSGAFMTIEVGKLVARGVLAKNADPDDRRRVVLSVTARGARLARALAPHQQRINDVLFASLDRRAFERLRELARELVQCGERALELITTESAQRGPARVPHRLIPPGDRPC